MKTTGTISNEGHVQLDGYEPMKARLLAISSTLIVYHVPGSRYWTNGGENYGPALVEVRGLSSLKRSNEAAGWSFVLADDGPMISFHPTQSRACFDAAQDLRTHGDRYAELLAKRNPE